MKGDKNSEEHNFQILECYNYFGLGESEVQKQKYWLFA